MLRWPGCDRGFEIGGQDLREGVGSVPANEFTREAVQLLESGSRSASEITRELGIARNQKHANATTWRSDWLGHPPR
ncbi:MAG: hypothetical protein A4E19_05390 [Nitrospira sp. SG-bin1]|nr:MAG: hypothetical protein A4E19_05390 [Nitrospira sp. SG-bin1]